MPFLCQGGNHECQWGRGCGKNTYFILRSKLFFQYFQPVVGGTCGCKSPTVLPMLASQSAPCPSAFLQQPCLQTPEEPGPMQGRVPAQQGRAAGPGGQAAAAGVRTFSHPCRGAEEKVSVWGCSRCGPLKLPELYTMVRKPRG